MRQPWHTRTGWIVALLILFAPVGIFLLYRAGIWRGATRHVVAAVAGFVFLVVAIGSAAGDPKDEEADKPKEPAVVSTTPAAPSSSAPPPTTEAAAPVVATTEATTPVGTTTAPEPPPRTTEAPPEPMETRPAATKPAATTKAAAPTTKRPVTPEPTQEEVFYANCDAVRAANAAPIYRGQPGYSTKLDRDKDGVACET